MTSLQARMQDRKLAAPGVAALRCDGHGYWSNPNSCCQGRRRCPWRRQRVQSRFDVLQGLLHDVALSGQGCLAEGP